jgi:hypothetical protein
LRHKLPANQKPHVGYRENLPRGIVHLISLVDLNDHINPR